MYTKTYIYETRTLFLSKKFKILKILSAFSILIYYLPKHYFNSLVNIKVIKTKRKYALTQSSLTQSFRNNIHQKLVNYKVFEKSKFRYKTSPNLLYSRLIRIKNIKYHRIFKSQTYKRKIYLLNILLYNMWKFSIFNHSLIIKYFELKLIREGQS